MANNWTDEQLLAIEHRGSALLVSAAAGSGKTAVLVERLLRRVLDDREDISRFLMITYTNAAASELRAKILSALTERCASAAKDAYLRRQLTLAHSAHISTIHAFCMGLLRTHGHLIGIAGDVRILDDGEGKLLLDELCEEVLEECYGQDWFIPAANALFGDRDDRYLFETVLSLHDKSRSQVYPERWLERLAEDFSDLDGKNLEDTAWGRYLLSQAVEELESLEILNRCAIQDIAEYEAMAKAYLPAFESDQDMLHDLIKASEKGWDAAVNAFSGISFKKLGALRGCENPGLQERVKYVRDKVIKKKISRMREEWFLRSSQVLLAELESVAPAAYALTRAARLLDEKFAAEKTRRGVVDYSDLEHYALKLLVENYDQDTDTVTPTQLARELSLDWAEIMVDEYQDSNCIQDVIFRALSRDEQNIVMVGDIKQSIYRFRLAEPRIFLKKYREFTPKRDAAPGQACTVKLSRNFRSRKQVLDGGNGLFSRIMSEGLGDLKYTRDEHLNLGAQYSEYEGQSNAAEAVILDLAGVGAADDDEFAPTVREFEAEWIAKKIRSMMQSGFSVREKDGSRRKMRWGDVVILMRSLAGKANIYENALAHEGIPCVSDRASGLLDAPEVSMVISMLTVIDNPLNEIALVGALRSPLFAFSADDLSCVRRAGGSFISALETTARGTGDTARKCRGFLDTLNHLRLLSSDMSCDKLIWKLYCMTNALGLVGALPDGASRCGNLLKLYEYAQSFEQGGFRGLYAFLERIARLAERGENIAAASSAGGDAVRIMTVHKSKGLEFPIVFLADFNHEFNTADLTPKVIVHPELGLGLKMTRTSPRAAYPTVARTAVAQKLLREMKSEEMRVLYVALTRAKEKLFIVCTLKSAEKKLISVYSSTAGEGGFTAAELSDAGPVPWLLAALLYAKEGRVLREHIGAPPIPEAESVDIEVSLVTPEGRESAKAEGGNIRIKPAEDMGSVQEFAARFEHVYPHAAAAEAPSKITATGLRTMIGENCIDAEGIPEPEERVRHFARPEFVRESGLTPTEKGVAAHLAMQLLDYGKCTDIDGVRKELARLYTKGQFTEREFEAVEPEMLMRFFSSPIGQEVMAAEKLWREFRFSVLVPADHLAPGETMLLQGVADLFFDTPDGIVLVDFKTDRGVDEQEAKSRYGIQLKAYAYALEEICGRKVCRRVLFFLRSGKTVEID